MLTWTLAGSIAGLAAGVLVWKMLTSFPKPEPSNPNSYLSGSKPEPPTEEPPVSLTRVYVSTEGQLCAWGKKPARINPTWLGHDHGTGLYGVTPYALDEVLAEMEASGLHPDVSPNALSMAKRANIVAEATNRVHEGKVPLPASNLANGEKLDEYQRVALAFADATMGRFLIADQMGLGKSVMAIAVARHLDCDRILIVTRSNVKSKWGREVRRFDGGSFEILDGTRTRALDPRTKYVILNYDLLPDWLDEIKEWGPDLVVPDEVHWIANENAIRSRAVREIALQAPFCVGLSGTPIRNRPRHLWNILDILQPGWWGKRHDFERAFCNGKTKAVPGKGKRSANGKWGKFNLVWVADGISNEPILHSRLRGVLLRRLKEDVQKSLPERRRVAYPVQLDRASKAEYGALEARLAACLQAKDYGDVLNLITLMRKTSSMGRIRATVDEALEIVKHREKPVVIFGYFLDVLDRIESDLRKEGLRVARIDGSTPSHVRGQIEELFQAGELDVFVGQIVAAGEGINLWRADTTLHHDITWSPFEQDQAESRVHRRGQTASHTTHIYFLGEGTLDEKTLDLTLKKLQMSRSILDTGEKLDAELLRQLKADHFDQPKTDVYVGRSVTSGGRW